MSFFQLANNEEVIRFETEDGQDWIEVKADLSKAEFNKLALAGPSSADDRAGGLTFMDKVVQTFMRDWSFKDAEGNAVEFDMRLYKNLQVGPANWISGKCMEHFNNLTKIEVEDAEGKPENSES